MERKILKNKPLVEAIFELKWQLQELETGGKIDPHYKLLVGRLYDRCIKQYPFHDQLPTASMPDEMLENVVQHRFRKGEHNWPLIQIGPGIYAVNDTKNYVWEDFEKRVVKGVNALYESYPDSKKLEITNLMLRYIDAIEFDFEKQDIFEFLKEKMKIEVTMPTQLFEDTEVEKKPLTFNGVFSFPCVKPKGIVTLRFGQGKKEDVEALIWETIVQSQSDDVPKLPSELKAWLNDAHTITDDWFFKIIKGDLLKRFE